MKKCFYSEDNKGENLSGDKIRRGICYNQLYF